MGAAMNTNNFPSRLLHSQIAHLSILLMLACSIPAFSDVVPPPAKVITFRNPIHVAAKAGDLAKVGAMLKDNPALVSSRDQGWTPLHLAVRFGYKEVVELLIANKADVNAKDIRGKTPLQHANAKKASWNKNEDIIEFLRQHGGQ
jgi:ankyrin repeat protein